MARSARKNTESGIPKNIEQRLFESLFLIVMVVAAYLLLTLLTHDVRDPGFSSSGDGVVSNLGGSFGAWISDFLLVVLGYMAWLLPVLLGAAAFRLLQERTEPVGWPEWGVRLAGLVLVVLSGCMLFEMQPRGDLEHTGGIVGDLLAAPMVQVMGFTGAALINLAVLLVGITLFTGLSWIDVVDRVGGWALAAWSWSGEKISQGRDWMAGRRARAEREVVRKRDTVKRKKRPEVRIEPRVETEASGKPGKKISQRALFKNLPAGSHPPLDLLDEPPEQSHGYSDETLKAMSRQVELKLSDFGIDVEVVAVHPGPVITRFELQPAAGVKGSQISNLSKDLARGLSVISVRVVDVIPGKSVIGLEIPNTKREIVYLREILSSEAYEKANSPLTLGLGKDISGRPVVADVARMPHLLVAGTTGSGKSVAVNAMLLSLLYRLPPERCRMILIDPKMLELSVYDDIPHLLSPVVTDPKKAVDVEAVAGVAEDGQLAAGRRNSAQERRVQERTELHRTDMTAVLVHRHDTAHGDAEAAHLDAAARFQRGVDLHQQRPQPAQVIAPAVRLMGPSQRGRRRRVHLALGDAVGLQTLEGAEQLRQRRILVACSHGPREVRL